MRSKEPAADAASGTRGVAAPGERRAGILDHDAARSTRTEIRFGSPGAARTISSLMSSSPELRVAAAEALLDLDDGRRRGRGEQRQCHDRQPDCPHVAQTRRESGKLRDMHDLACVVHLHSTHSDGTGTVPEIARAAARAKADVVLLTDHDTLEAKRRGEEGWYGDVLLLAGEEVSPLGQEPLPGVRHRRARSATAASTPAGSRGGPRRGRVRLRRASVLGGLRALQAAGHAVRRARLRRPPRNRAVELRQRHRRAHLRASPS